MESFLLEWQSLDYSYKKQTQIQIMAARELEDLKEEQVQKEIEIINAIQNIENLKKELLEAQELKSRRVEYDVKAKEISRLPIRQKSQRYPLY